MDHDASSAPVDGGVRVKNELATGRGRAGWLFFCSFFISTISNTDKVCR